MILDYELMFLDDKDGTKKNVSAGVLGEILDLRAKGQGKGFDGRIAIAFSSDTTASANPEIQFSIETSDTEEFTKSTTLPLMFPVPLKKADLKEGTILVSPLPKVGLERYVRLKIGVDSPINCLGIKAGFVFDADEA